MNRSALQISNTGAASVLRDLWEKYGPAEFHHLTSYEDRVVEIFLDAADEIAELLDEEAIFAGSMRERLKDVEE